MHIYKEIATVATSTEADYLDKYVCSSAREKRNCSDCCIRICLWKCNVFISKSLICVLCQVFVCSSNSKCDQEHIYEFRFNLNKFYGFDDDDIG